MVFIKKYFDFIFIVLSGLILVLISEYGYLEKLAKFGMVPIMFAYFIGKAVGRWQIKPRS